MYFCGDDGNLFRYERMMQQIPRFRERRSGIYIKDIGASLERTSEEERNEEMLLRMIAYGIPASFWKRVSEDKDEKLFMNEAHEDNFFRLMTGKKQKKMITSGQYLAAAFLLTADEWLWDMVKTDVTDIGIFFDNMTIRGANTDQYVLFHLAKEIYTGEQFVSMEELGDSELINPELLNLIINSFILRYEGPGIMEEARRHADGK